MLSASTRDVHNYSLEYKMQTFIFGPIERFMKDVSFTKIYILHMFVLNSASGLHRLISNTKCKHLFVRPVKWFIKRWFS